MPSSRQSQLKLDSDSPKRSDALGALLGQSLRSGDLICLCGDLGAGKTVFSRGIGVGWGASIALTSPTYNLVHEHRCRDEGALYHIDLYRIIDKREVATIGLEDILDEAAAVIIEWPERMASLLPADHLWIDFVIGPAHERHLIFSARGERHEQLLAAFGARVQTMTES